MNRSQEGRRHQARVLIVDDDRKNRQVLEAMLSPEGFVLETASSGEDALALVAEQPPDLILLDVMMPGLDGYEVAARLKDNVTTKHIPIIMVTAADDHEARIRGLAAGAEEFLSKPVDRTELSMRVRNLLRLKAYGDYHDEHNQLLEAEVVSRTAERTRILEQHATTLRESEERTNYALGAALMGVWEIDLATQHLTWSETMAPLFGLTPEQAPTTAEGFFALIHPDDRQLVKDSMMRPSRDDAELEVEFRVIWPDGTTHWKAGKARVLCDANGVPARLLGIGADISGRKSLEAQFRQAQKMEAVGQLAGGVAHDFNNLLTVILGYSNFVIDALGAGDPRRSDMEEVVKAGHRASALTRQLLAFSRKQVLQPTIIELNALVTGMRQMLSRLIGEHVELVTILAADLGSVRADPGQLEQVLMNLVVNARDAMPSGGRLAVETANVELDLPFARALAIHPGSYVMLAISDSGIGMTEDTKRRLFEPFFTTKDSGKGTGLGLATVYGIVKQSGGCVWVYSEIGQGATFKVYLPRVDERADVEPPSTRADEAPTPTETVLVVEDEDAVRLLTCRILEEAGYRVFNATNPQQAEALFEHHAGSFNLLVTDVIMPGSTGPNLFNRLGLKSPKLKVLYVSGYTDDTIIHQGQLDPGVEFLQKPFTAEALTRRVRQVLDR